MSIQGWQLTISTGSYRTPSMCSSCLGPRETEVKAQVSEKHGNVRTTLTMGFPYCNACAGRVTSESRRAGLVIGGAVVLGVIFAIVAWMTDDSLYTPIAFGAGAAIGAAISVGIALLTRPAPPQEPATARGEAVLLLDTSGNVLCTNQRFAELLAQANSATVKPGSKWMTTEAWAPMAAAFSVFFVFAFWLKYAPPPHRHQDTPPPTPAAVKKPAPAPQPAKPAPRGR